MTELLDDIAFLKAHYDQHELDSEVDWESFTRDDDTSDEEDIADDDPELDFSEWQESTVEIGTDTPLEEYDPNPARDKRGRFTFKSRGAAPAGAKMATSGGAGGKEGETGAFLVADEAGWGIPCSPKEAAVHAQGLMAETVRVMGSHPGVRQLMAGNMPNVEVYRGGQLPYTGAGSYLGMFKSPITAPKEGLKGSRVEVAADRRKSESENVLLNATLSKAKQRHIAGTSVRDLHRHEFGHAVQEQLAVQKPALNKEWSKIWAKNKKALASSLSHYAGHDADEGFAEVFGALTHANAKKAGNAKHLPADVVKFMDSILSGKGGSRRSTRAR